MVKKGTRHVETGRGREYIAAATEQKLFARQSSRGGSRPMQRRNREHAYKIADVGCQVHASIGMGDAVSWMVFVQTDES